MTEHERDIEVSKRVVDQTRQELENLRQSERSLWKHIKATREALRQPADSTKQPDISVEPK